MLRSWLELGYCAEQFSRLTPRMIFAAFEAGHRRLRREYNDRVTLAYNIVRLTRAPKPPPLRQILIALDPPSSATASWKRQRDMERRALQLTTRKAKR